MSEQIRPTPSVLDRLKAIEPEAEGNRLAFAALRHLTNPADIVNFVAEYSALVFESPDNQGDDMSKAISIARRNLQWMLGYCPETVTERWEQALGGIEIGSPLEATVNSRSVIHYEDAEDLRKKLGDWIDDNTTI